MTHLRRQSLTNDAMPSIDPHTSSGRGTARREDNSTPNVDRRNVIAVAKGLKIDHAPVSEVKTDLVQMGRAQVLARSGNDAGQHEEEWENDDGNFDELAAGDAAAPAMPLGKGDIALLIGVGLFALYAFRR